MALNVIWTAPAGSPSYNIKVNRVTHSIVRTPHANALPGQTAGTAGQIFVLDLGQYLQTITIDGVVDTVADVPNGYPSKANLELATKTWYIQYAFAGTEAMSHLQLESGMTYHVFPKDASFTKNAAQETWWDFNISFIAQS